MWRKGAPAFGGAGRVEFHPTRPFPIVQLLLARLDALVNGRVVCFRRYALRSSASILEEKESVDDSCMSSKKEFQRIGPKTVPWNTMILSGIPSVCHPSTTTQGVLCRSNDNITATMSGCISLVSGFATKHSLRTWSDVPEISEQ